MTLLQDLRCARRPPLTGPKDGLIMWTPLQDLRYARSGLS